MIFFFLCLCAEGYFVYKDDLSLRKMQELNPDKKIIRKYLMSGLLRVMLFFLVVFIISFLLNLIPCMYYWKGRNVALIDAVRPELNVKFNFFRCIVYFIFLVSIILSIIFKIKKKRLALSFVFPVIAFSGLISLLDADNGLKYYKNPLADTVVSDTFKPLNVPYLREGMTSEEVLELLGDPLEKKENKFIYAKEDNPDYSEYDYFKLDVYFENDRVVKIDKEWLYED
jgi:hypothetical protein